MCVEKRQRVRPNDIVITVCQFLMHDRAKLQAGWVNETGQVITRAVTTHCSWALWRHREPQTRPHIKLSFRVTANGERCKQVHAEPLLNWLGSSNSNCLCRHFGNWHFGYFETELGDIIMARKYPSSLNETVWLSRRLVSLESHY